MQTIYLHDPGSPGQADSRSQASAFPPNFIHSLDATHMMLTALACEVSTHFNGVALRRSFFPPAQDITFAAVHDSYWTHAADIPTLNERLRDAFVKLHETSILNNLAEEVRHLLRTVLVVRTLINRRRSATASPAIWSRATSSREPR